MRRDYCVLCLCLSLFVSYALCLALGLFVVWFVVRCLVFVVNRL